MLVMLANEIKFAIKRLDDKSILSTIYQLWNCLCAENSRKSLSKEQSPFRCYVAHLVAPYMRDFTFYYEKSLLWWTYFATFVFPHKNPHCNEPRHVGLFSDEVSYCSASFVSSEAYSYDFLISSLLGTNYSELLLLWKPTRIKAP